MEIEIKIIGERLERAHQNIVNLQSEISAFFDNCKYPVGRDKDYESIRKFWDDFYGIEIPPRFSILAGEVIHHLRSSLDNVAWYLSTESYRESNPTAIEFPIYKCKPSDKNEIGKFNRKIKGINSLAALGLIKNAQPYLRPDPLNDPLWIVHEMDTMDKHRDLNIIASGFEPKSPKRISRLAKYYTQGKFPIPVHIARDLYKNLKFSPSVSFRKFGQRENQTVITNLLYLEREVRRVIADFSDELLKC